MPYANNNGVKIYYEVEGQGPPLVLAHALGSTGMQMWRRDKYDEALKSEFQLILIDFRCHGLSEKPHEASACDIRLLATDVLAVLDDIKVAKTHYWGYSLGSRVGFWLATHYSERFLSFILAGMTPYDIPDSTAKMVKGMQENLKLVITDPEAAVLQQEKILKRPMTSEEKMAFLSRDVEAIIAMWTAWVNSPPLTDQDLTGISLPCLVSCGELDQGGFHPGARECVNHISKAKFVSLPGLEHGTAFSRIDLVLPHVKEFLAKVSKK